MEMPLAMDTFETSSAGAAPASRFEAIAERPAVLLALSGFEGRGRLLGWLEALGYPTDVACSGVEALGALRRTTGPAVVLVDDALDGARVIERLRREERDRYVYAVLVVGEYGREAANRARAAGADDWVVEPVELEELKVCLQGAERILELERRLAAARDRFKAQATLDGLTGLPNRRAITDCLAREIGRAERERADLAVVMVDLDHFKRVNDVHGHLAGDAVIREAGRRMKDALRVYDAVGRWGGEEFVVVLPGADERTAQVVAERLRRSIEGAPVSTDDGPVAMTASLGVAAARGADHVDADELLKRADVALYAAKERGRNQVHCAEPVRPRLAAV